MNALITILVIVVFTCLLVLVAISGLFSMMYYGMKIGLTGKGPKPNSRFVQRNKHKVLRRPGQVRAMAASSARWATATHETNICGSGGGWPIPAPRGE